MNGAHSISYCADPGADTNVISREQLMVLKEKDDTVKLVMMKEIPVKTAGGHILRASMTVDVMLQIKHSSRLCSPHIAC